MKQLLVNGNMVIPHPAASRESRRRWGLMSLIIKHHLLRFMVVFPLQLIFVTMSAAKCWFRCACVLCRVPLSKCSFANHIFALRNTSVKSTGVLNQHMLAGRTKSLTPVLQSPIENSGRGKKPTISPGQAGWWQCTERVQGEAWFLDTGNSSPNCAMWKWVYDFSSPGEK